MQKDPVIALGETWNERNTTAIAERTLILAVKQDLLSRTSDEATFTDQLIAGCMVKRPSGKEPVRQEVHQAQTRLTAAQEEAQKAKAFESDVLQKFGISPLAVVPAALWNQITQAWGLYRFEHLDKDSKTHARHVWKPETVASQWAFAFKCLVIALVLWVITAAFVMNGYEYGWLGAIPGIISSLLCFLVLKDIPQARKHVQEYLQKEQTPGGFLPELWPHGHDYTAEHANSSADARYYRIDVRFPGAPYSFGQKLLQLWKEKQHVCIAAAPQAVQASLGTAEVIPKVIPNAEPIQYIKSPDGSTVAILDRFGDFENEAHAVQQAQDITAKYYA